MDKKKREQIILIILVLGLAAMLPRVMFKKAQPSGRTAFEPDVFSRTLQPAAEPAAPKPLAQPEIPFFEITDPFDVPSVLQEKLVLMEDQIGRFATEQQNQQARQIPPFDISGVIWGRNTSIAFINDKAYRVGDTAEGAKILDIDKNGVHFLFNNREEFVGIKQPAEGTNKSQEEGIDNYFIRR